MCHVSVHSNNMTEKDMHQHNGANICGKCNDLIYRPRVRPE